MQYTNRNPYTPSDLLYSSSQSPLKYVPQPGPIPAELVEHPSECESSQSEGLKHLLPPQTQANVNDGSIYGLERDMCRDFLNAAESLGYALRRLSKPISNQDRNPTLHARLQKKAADARAVIATQSEEVMQMITDISTMND